MVKGPRLRIAWVALAAAILAAPSLAWMVRPAGHLAPPAHAAPARDAAQRPAVHAPAVQAKSAYLMDANTGEALFQKFPTTRRPMASTTKLMTGLLAAESGRLDEIATTSRNAAGIGETTMGLVAGEQVAVGDLLYGLMMPSGNDAAIVLAEHLAGSVPAFVDQMNARAAAMGLADTHFTNPHGIDVGRFFTTEHYSSAHDLAVLGAAALANPALAKAAGTTFRDVAGPPGQPPHHLRHLLGALWWYPGVIGGKTGWTERSGQVRVAVAERAGTRLVAVVMDSPDNVPEIRDLFDYGFTIDAKGDPSGPPLVPLNGDAFPSPDASLLQAWQAYKQLALDPDGHVRAGANGDGATSDAQAAALLYAVWFGDRGAFDSMWGWTNANLSRRRSNFRDALFAGRWAGGTVSDWANSTGADQRIAAALLLASRLWHEPAYLDAAKPILDAVLNKAAVSWDNGQGLAAANSYLKTLDPVTTSAASLTPAFYRMFTEASRNAAWLSLLDGTYTTLAQATAADGPLGGGAGLLPAWFSVAKTDGQVGSPIDPSWQSTGFADSSPALAWQLALDLTWNGEPRAKALLGPTARLVTADLAQRGRVLAAYTRGGAAASSAETGSYGKLAGVELAGLPGADPYARTMLQSKLQSALAARDPDRILDAIGGLWLLAGGPPDYWRIWSPPADLPTTRNDAVIPPADARPWRYFTETGHVVQGAFLNYFNLSGGLTVFGYPRTDELSEDGHVVQYFQRARLEYVQARAGAEVVPALLGAQALVDRGLRSRMETQPIAPFDSSDTLRFIPETGHSVGGGFKTFYEKNGGVAVLGYPLSEEFVQDGVTVQYFQRAVLDYLPGKPVQVELLGDDLLRQKGWLN